MQADADAHGLADGWKREKILENLEEGLASLYTKTALAMEHIPNDRLARIMIYHDQRYHTGTANEMWHEAVTKIKTLQGPKMAPSTKAKKRS